MNSIVFDEQKRIFALNAGESSYLMGLAESGEGKKYLGHIGFTRRGKSPAGADMLRLSEYSYIREGRSADKCTFMDGFPFEYPAGGESRAARGSRGDCLIQILSSIMEHVDRALDLVSHGKIELSGQD